MKLRLFVFALAIALFAGCAQAQASSSDEAVSIAVQETVALGDETFAYSVVNSGDDEVWVILSPALEKETGGQWEQVVMTGGICGMPDPVADQFDGSAYLTWYEGLEAGTYRMYMSAYADFEGQGERVVYSNAFSME